jgi:hypothetical protein
VILRNLLSLYSTLKIEVTYFSESLVSIGRITLHDKTKIVSRNSVIYKYTNIYVNYVTFQSHKTSAIVFENFPQEELIIFTIITIGTE